MTSIRLLNLSHSDILHIHSYAFNHSEHIGTVDLSSSMISNLDSHAFDHLSNVSRLDLSGNLIRFLDKSIFQQLIHSIKQIDLDNNPIQCDCSMEWYLEQRSERFKLPDVCTGPIGYECLSPNELQQSQLPCYLLHESNNETKRKNLCEHREKTVTLNSAAAASMYRLDLFCLLLFKRFFLTNWLRKNKWKGITNRSVVPLIHHGQPWRSSLAENRCFSCVFVFIDVISAIKWSTSSRIMICEDDFIEIGLGRTPVRHICPSALAISRKTD